MAFKTLEQAYEMQDFAYNAAMALKSQLSNSGKLSLTKDDAQSIGTLTRAWEIAQERVRIARGKPLPGSITWEKKRSVGSKRSAGSGSMLSMPTPAPADATQANEAAGVDENAGNV